MMVHEEMEINVSLYYSFNDCMKVNQNDDLEMFQYLLILVILCFTNWAWLIQIITSKTN
jgi:hypothetical protein